MTNKTSLVIYAKLILSLIPAQFCGCGDGNAIDGDYVFDDVEVSNVGDEIDGEISWEIATHEVQLNIECDEHFQYAKYGPAPQISGMDESAYIANGEHWLCNGALNHACKTYDRLVTLISDVVEHEPWTTYMAQTLVMDGSGEIINIDRNGRNALLELSIGAEYRLVTTKDQSMYDQTEVSLYMANALIYMDINASYMPTEHCITLYGGEAMCIILRDVCDKVESYMGNRECGFKRARIDIVVDGVVIADGILDHSVVEVAGGVLYYIVGQVAADESRMDVECPEWWKYNAYSVQYYDIGSIK